MSSPRVLCTRGDLFLRQTNYQLPSEPYQRGKPRSILGSFARRSRLPKTFTEEQMQLPRLLNFRATIRLTQIKSAGVARPHFLIACEDLYRNGAAFRRPQLFRLPAFARLTRRQR